MVALVSTADDTRPDLFHGEHARWGDMWVAIGPVKLVVALHRWRNIKGHVGRRFEIRLSRRE